MIQIKVGTTEWRSCPDGKVDEGYVLFKGEFLYEDNHFTPAMVWDDALENVRPKNDKDRDTEGAVQRSRLEVQKQAILDGTDQSSPLHMAVAEVYAMLATKADKA